MITLLILAAIGAVAGGIGGALTNGLDGFVLGGSAGFVLGVVTWITENIAEQRIQELHPDHLVHEFQRTTPSFYDQPATRHQPPDERSCSR